MLKENLVHRIKAYVAGADTETVTEVLDAVLEACVAGDSGAEQLEDAFGKDVDFGTGGLRGIMGAGSNRLNRVTVAKATQGLAEYIRQVAGDGGSVVITHDSRNQSEEFARQAALVVAGNGLKAYLSKTLRPTPWLSFAVRHLSATAGIVVTASHNPREYNGYKVSWDDGGQVLPPHDRAIIDAARAVDSMRDVSVADWDNAIDSGRIVLIEEEIDEAYLAAIYKQRVQQEANLPSIRIAYTPLHGTGGTLVPTALAQWGFTQVDNEPSQSTPDGNFSTASSPNPEERVALERVLELARTTGADLVMATDPDADRIGIAVPSGDDFVLLSGNQVAALLAWYVCSTRQREGARQVIVKTIVTSNLVARIAEERQVQCESVLTGFKYIAEKMREYETAEPRREFLMGCEESYGYLVGGHCRDKDAVVSACVIAEMVAWLKAQGKSLVDALNELYLRHGVHVERQLSKSLPGLSGTQRIQEMMEKLRTDPPSEIAGVPVTSVTDLKINRRRNSDGQITEGLGFPASNVIIMDLGDGSQVVARPSGTEPKIKFYFMIVGDRNSLEPNALAEEVSRAEAKCQSLVSAFDEWIDQV